MSEVTRLRVGDEGFLVSSMIERCPKLMMLRELVKNALEAAATAPAGERRVVLSSVPIAGVPKLAIWNGGRGMDADELFGMCDIAASIRKEHRLDGNFGMGAKVASLPSNQHGLRYRSCHDGRVHEVVLGARDGVYGRLRRAGPDGALHDVLEVTGAASIDGHDLSSDWTEVVLFGNRAEQDTVRDPYGGAPPMPPHWPAEELGYRFFRLPEDTELTIALGDGPVRFVPYASRIARDCTRHGSVTLPDGVVLHYVHAAAADGGTPGAVHATCALLHADELYDVHRGPDWLHAAPVFGIPFGAHEISVLIELPATMGALPDAYRQFLRRAGDGQVPLACRQFAPLVHRHRPDWLVALIERRSPSVRVPAGVHDDLDRLLRSLGVRRRKRLIQGGARAPAPVPAPGLAAAEVRSSPAPVAALQAPPSQSSRPAHGVLDPDADPPWDGLEYEPSPEILMLREGREIAARGLAGRAGRYYPETHQLFLNALYPAVDAMRAALLEGVADQPDAERVHRLAQRLAEQSMASRVGRMLVFALARQGSWTDREVERAASAEALSLAADDIAQNLAAACEMLSEALDGAVPDRPA